MPTEEEQLSAQVQWVREQNMESMHLRETLSQLRREGRVRMRLKSKYVEGAWARMQRQREMIDSNNRTPVEKRGSFEGLMMEMRERKEVDREILEVLRKKEVKERDIRAI